MKVPLFQFPPFEVWYQNDCKWSGKIGEYYCEVHPTSWSMSGDETRYGCGIATSHVPLNIYVEPIARYNFFWDHQSIDDLKEAYEKATSEVVTCNELYGLNDYLINRPGRFHYHFRFEYPSDSEIQEYLCDKLDRNYWSQIDAVIAFSRKVDLNYDCLRSIAFELNTGNDFADAIKDLNMMTKGIGNKVADCICLYGLQHFEAYPIDTWMKKLIDDIYSGHFDTTPYASCAGYVQQLQFYYYRSLKKTKQGGC